MAQALSLAESVLYMTDPNPRVGCVIVRDGQVLGQGATQVAGGPHAEVMAIRDAYEKGYAQALAGATFYVTLEPCSHYGRTPPCVDALIKERPSRVVIAMSDPNPLVAGRGVTKLREAGIEVVLNVLADEALALNPGFVSRMAQQRPWVWSKIACSLDGQIALSNGQSQWITGAQARADGHHWRARSSVVLTGLGTVSYDNPSLNVRYIKTSRQPIRAVIDSQFAIAEDRSLFNGEPVWFFVNRVDEAKTERLAQKNVEVIVVAADGQQAGQGGSNSPQPHINLHEVMRILAERGVNEVHVEAGSGLNGALLQAGLIDELLVYMAPKILGPGLGAFKLSALSDLQESFNFEFIEQKQVGDDMRLRLRAIKRWQTLMAAIVAE